MIKHLNIQESKQFGPNSKKPVAGSGPPDKSPPQQAASIQ
jgi:hypothetical protein